MTTIYPQSLNSSPSSTGLEPTALLHSSSPPCNALAICSVLGRRKEEARATLHGSQGLQMTQERYMYLWLMTLVLILKIFKVPFQLVRTQAFYGSWMETPKYLTANQINEYFILITLCPAAILTMGLWSSHATAFIPWAMKRSYQGSQSWGFHQAIFYLIILSISKQWLWIDFFFPWCHKRWKGKCSG